MKYITTLLVILSISAILLTGCASSEPPVSSQELASSPAIPAPETNPDSGTTTTTITTPGTTATETTPEPSSEAAQVTSPETTASSTPGTGKIDIYVTDPPPPEMDEIWVTIKNLSVHKTGGSWTTIAESPAEFDLKAIEGIEEYFGSKIVDEGKYTQIRMEVDSVRIVVGEDEYQAKVPSGEIKLVGTFEVEADATTAITLDFNGKESVHVTGNNRYMFKPVIKLLVDHGSSGETPEPTVVSVTPDTGYRGQALEAVLITGTNLDDATAVSFGDNITIESFTVDSDTQVTANITIDADAPAGARDVSVTTPDGTGTLPDGFTVLAPVPAITAVSPVSGERGQTLAAVITGNNFTGATSVSFSDNITVESFTVDSVTQITASITIDADAPAGARDVSVTTPDGTGTLPDGFTVTVP